MSVDKSKRVQMHLSFGMIFSIILIVVFLAVAFYAVQKFLGFQKEISYRQFKENLQSDIDNMWKSTQGSQIYTYKLPSSVKSICFVNDNFYQMKINLKDRFLDEELEHIDMERTLGTQQELCFASADSQIRFILVKKYSEPLVTILEYE